MKIYISGRISGLPFPEVQEKFQTMQDFLEDLDIVPVNPLHNGLTETHKWEQHMVKDIEMLLPCDGILMLDNWRDSTGAGIEYDIAVRTGKHVWFETQIVESQNTVLRIQQAIHEVTGLKFNEYITPSRKIDGFFARMIFAYHCRQNCIKLTDIARYVHRDFTSIVYLLKKYEKETKYNPHFRKLAEKVEMILNREKA